MTQVVCPEAIEVGKRFDLTKRVQLEVTTLQLNGTTINRVGYRAVIDGKPDTEHTLPLDLFCSIFTPAPVPAEDLHELSKLLDDSQPGPDLVITLRNMSEAESTALVRLLYKHVGYGASMTVEKRDAHSRQ